MTRLSLALLGLLLWSTGAGALDEPWGAHMAAGAAALHRGKFGAARESFAAALKAAESLEPHDRRRRGALTQLAAAELGLGAVGRARPLLERALDSWLASEQPTDLELAATLHGLAQVYRAGGQPAKARQRLRWAYAIEEKLLPAGDPALARTSEALAGLSLADDQIVAASAEAPEPAETQAKAVTSSAGYAVQLASYRSEQGARDRLAALERTLPELLDARDLAIRRVELGGRGTFYRLLAAGFADHAAAHELCVRLEARGQDCLVIREGVVPTSRHHEGRQAMKAPAASAAGVSPGATAAPSITKPAR